ncbi:MAG TPA: GntR family transcriptional regulator [Mycobacterium sp.]|jgi:GntR family transcriptional regulator|uniref:GntR family transcriptional regulator n=1 Tax=Mycobacterium sp. TaxID=1785 RepID=UPI002F3E6A95
MALKLSKQTLTQVAPHPPMRDQLADHIRQAIATGDLNPGDRVPSENDIANAINIDRATVGRALAILVNEGLIIRSQGRPTIVAPAIPVRHMSTNRYAEQLTQLRAGQRDTTAFVTDHGAEWDEYTVDPLEYDEETATETDAAYLGIKTGTKIMRRRMVKRLAGEPIQIQRSAVPMKIAKGKVLADPTVQPYPGGTLAELYDAGLIPDGSVLHVDETAVGRLPNPTERRLLNLTAPTPVVWDIVRVFSVDGNPVEVSRVIAPMAGHALHYETTVS